MRKKSNFMPVCVFRLDFDYLNDLPVLLLDVDHDFKNDRIKQEFIIEKVPFCFSSSFIFFCFYHEGAKLDLFFFL